MDRKIDYEFAQQVYEDLTEYLNVAYPAHKVMDEDKIPDMITGMGLFLYLTIMNVFRAEARSHASVKESILKLLDVFESMDMQDRVTQARKEAGFE